MRIHKTAEEGNQAAADRLERWLQKKEVKQIMVAAGNTPLDLYRAIAKRNLKLSHLHVYALDEYVGVPADEPRNCGNLLRGSVAQAWGIPPAQFFAVSSVAADAETSVRQHEERIVAAGGLDVVVLGLGQNGHLGFNEPGSARDSTAPE